MNVSEAEPIFNALFADINGYELSLGERRRMEGADKSLTYGEATLPVMDEILKALPTPPKGAFYDLGSGIGKAVMAVALLGNFSKCTGIELLTDLHTAADGVRAAYETRFKRILGEPQRSQEITFVNGDILKGNYNDAGMVFIQATCFPEEVLEGIQNLLYDVRRGTYVVTVTGEFMLNAFKLIREDRREMGWGKVTVYTYVRN